jgi:hypothetical protein
MSARVFQLPPDTNGNLKRISCPPVRGFRDSICHVAYRSYSGQAVVHCALEYGSYSGPGLGDSKCSNTRPGYQLKLTENPPFSASISPIESAKQSLIDQHAPRHTTFRSSGRDYGMRWAAMLAVFLANGPAQSRLCRVYYTQF